MGGAIHNGRESSGEPLRSFPEMQNRGVNPVAAHHQLWQFISTAGFDFHYLQEMWGLN
jgi:hypothetical protein